MRAKFNIEDIFPKVITMVENGFTITEALNILKVNKLTFYKKLNKEKKLLLRITKTANAQYSNNLY